MTPNKAVCCFLTVVLCAALASAEATHPTPQQLWSRWREVDLEYSVSYADYQAIRPCFDTEIASVMPFPCPLVEGPRGRVAVLVNTDLYPHIEGQLMVWLSDINTDGFEALLVEAAFETVEELRAGLRWAWQSDEGLVGCILVGDFPVAWYEMQEEDGPTVEFPFDLYYADLDGDFIDSDSNGLFDDHVDGAGSVTPDIWIGRLLASTLSGSEADHVNAYLAKNHLYRTGLLDAPHRVLLFIDNDWVDMRDGWEYAVGNLYDEIRTIDGLDQTNGEEYLKRLSNGYEWVNVMVHSGPDAHYFDYRDAYSIVHNYEIAVWETNALFLVPFACSNSRYVEPDYMGGWYIFGEDSKALCAIGCTKSGSLYYGTDMYKKLGSGRCLGHSFQHWFSGVAPYSEDDKSWFYGLTVLGDPTLRPPDTAPPLPPDYFRSTPTDGEDGIVLMWEASEADDLAGYRLYYDTEGYYPPFRGTGLPQGDSPIEIGSATSFTVKYEDMGQFDDIHWAVTAFDVRGNESDYSAPLDSQGDPCLNAPVVSWVWVDEDTHVSYEEGGTLMLYAWIEEDEDPTGTLRVELLLDSQPTGVLLHDDSSHGDIAARDGYYTNRIRIPARALQPGKYLISIVATDSDGNRSNEWPYLTISQQDIATRSCGLPEASLPPAWTHSGLTYELGDSESAPMIVASSLSMNDYIAEPYASITIEVYHPESKDDVESVELYFGGQPTGVFLTRYPDYETTLAFYWTWFYPSEMGLGPGQYLIEAVALDVDGNESDMFPYLWVN